MNPFAYNTVSLSHTSDNTYVKYTSCDKLNAAAWVTVHDGHDFSARVRNSVTLDDSIVEPGEKITVTASAELRGVIGRTRRVPMAA